MSRGDDKPRVPRKEKSGDLKNGAMQFSATVLNALFTKVPMTSDQTP